MSLDGLRHNRSNARHSSSLKREFPVDILLFIAVLAAGNVGAYGIGVLVIKLGERWLPEGDYALINRNREGLE